MEVVELTATGEDSYGKTMVTYVTSSAHPVGGGLVEERGGFTRRGAGVGLGGGTLERGVFSSYQDFERAMDDYSQRTYTIFNRRTSVKMPYKHVPVDLFPYCRLVYNCVHFGNHKTKGKGIRPHHSTFSLGCPVTLQLVYNRNMGAYKITKSVLEHNHPTSAEIYRTYPKNRRMNEEEQKKVIDWIRTGVKTHMVVRYARDEFAKQISPKDISNLRTKYKLSGSPADISIPMIGSNSNGLRSKRGSLKPVKSLKTYFNQSRARCGVRQAYGTICSKKAFSHIDHSLGLHESTTHTVAHTQENDYYVKSLLDSAMFTVGAECNSCDCPFFKKHGLPCVHVFAVLHHLNLELFHKSLIPDRYLSSGSSCESVIQLPTDGEVANPLDSEVQIPLESEIQIATETVIEISPDGRTEVTSNHGDTVSSGGMPAVISVSREASLPGSASHTWVPTDSSTPMVTRSKESDTLPFTTSVGGQRVPSSSSSTIVVAATKDKALAAAAATGNDQYILVKIPGMATDCQSFLVNSYDHGEKLVTLKEMMMKYADKVATLPTEAADRHTKEFHKVYTELLEERPYQTMQEQVTEGESP